MQKEGKTTSLQGLSSLFRIKFCIVKNFFAGQKSEELGSSPEEGLGQWYIEQCAMRSLIILSATPWRDHTWEDGSCIPLERDRDNVDEHDGEGEGEDARGACHGGEHSVPQERHVQVLHQGHQPEGVGEHDTQNVLARHHCNSTMGRK